MTPVSPHLPRAGLALFAGAALAMLALGLAPGRYYDLIEYRLFDIPAAMIPGRDTIPRAVTPAQLIEELLMALVIFLYAKEGWEAWRCERGPFAGRLAGWALVAVLGGMAGAAVVWAGVLAQFPPVDEAAGFATWAAPMGGEVAAVALLARMIWGDRAPALQLVLFLAILGTVLGLLVTGLAAPGSGGLRTAWLCLPLAAGLAGWYLLTRPLARPDLSERDRARAGVLWPWAPLAAVCWLGVALAGLPPALGFLPLLPAMPHARQSFGLFATAEVFLTDPLNRLARALLPLLPLLLFVFGFCHAGLDFGAAGAATLAALAAVVLGKPLGLALGAGLARLAGLHRPAALRDPVDVALALLVVAPGLTGAVLTFGSTLPGGAMTEAARLGFGLGLLAVALLAAALALTGSRRT